MAFNVPRYLHQLNLAALAGAAAGFVLPVFLVVERGGFEWRIFFPDLLFSLLPASLPAVRLAWMHADGWRSWRQAMRARPGRRALIVACVLMLVAVVGQLAGLLHIIWVMVCTGQPTFADEILGTISLRLFGVLALVGCWLADVVRLRQYQCRYRA